MAVCWPTPRCRRGAPSARGCRSSSPGRPWPAGRPVHGVHAGRRGRGRPADGGHRAGHRAGRWLTGWRTTRASSPIRAVKRRPGGHVHEGGQGGHLVLSDPVRSVGPEMITRSTSVAALERVLCGVTFVGHRDGMVTLAAAAADEGRVWWIWVLGGLVVWSVVAFFFAVVVGRGIRLADRRSPGTGVDDVLTTADLLPRTAPAAARVRRRAIPVPPSASRCSAAPSRWRPGASSCA